MSREIRFRGQCIMSGELVYGDLIHGVGAKSGKVYILPQRINLAGVKHCHPLDGVQVKPETVGQFTALHDKNGREVFEGDILRFPFELGIAYVINDGFRFAVKSPGSEAIDYESPETLQQCEIIGNLHEHPELLTK